MRVLQIGADRSKRGILYPGTPACKRQEAYAKAFGALDIVGFSLKSDGAKFIDVSHLHIHPTNSSSRFLYVLNAIRIARKLPKPDVVSVQDPFEAGIAGWLIARMRKVPLHVQVHTDFLSPEYVALSFTNRVRGWVAGFVLRRATRIRVVSERVREAIENHYHLEIPITVLPIFAEVERLKFSLPDELLAERFRSFSSRVLVVARLEPEKDVATAIRLFAGYAPVSACLIIVGEGSERENLENFVVERHLEHRVFFEGTADPERYYKTADLLLATSKYEGYGLVIVEALAAGTPVISTDVGVARELGAIVGSSFEELGEKLVEWFQHGARKAHLQAYPYKDFDDYVRAYCEDVGACVSPT